MKWLKTNKFVSILSLRGGQNSRLEDDILHYEIDVKDELKDCFSCHLA